MELDPFEEAPLPTTLAYRRIRLGDVADQRQHQRQRQLGRRDYVPTRRIEHYDASARGDIQIDVVYADAGATYHLQAFGRFQNVGSDVRATPDHQRLVVADHRLQRRRVYFGSVMDLETILRLQDLDPLLRYRIG